MSFHPSLRARLTAYATLGSILLFVTGALLLYHDLTGQLSQAISAELSVRLHDLEAVPLGTTSDQQHRLALTQVITTDGTVLEPAGAVSLLTPSEIGAATRHRIVVDRQIPGVSEESRLMARSLVVPGEGVPVIGVSATSTKPLEAARDHLSRVLYVVGPGLAGLVALSTWILAGAALHPVRRMAREAETISLARSGERLIQPEGGDEIAELGRTLNDMLARIEGAIAHERSFIDDAAHELRTPLAILRGELELATFDLADAAVIRASLASALEETDRLTRMTTDLLTLARSDAGELEAELRPVDVTAAVRSIARLLPRPEGTLVEVTGDEVWAIADPRWVAQIATNLLANAVRHATSTVSVSVASVGEDAHLVVADDGAGFPPGFMSHAFDRFARVDGARTRSDGGSGLGLAITATLVRSLGGTIVASNGPPLGGACLAVTLPAPGGQTARASTVS